MNDICSDQINKPHTHQHGIERKRTPPTLACSFLSLENVGWRTGCSQHEVKPLQDTSSNAASFIYLRLDFRLSYCAIVLSYLHIQGPGGTLNVEVIGMLVRNLFLENPKKYPDFDFKPLKNTQIAILRAVLRAVFGKMTSIFQKFSRRP